MAGTFILSLDCEGKWGMADHLTADHHRWLTTARLRAAYEQLLSLFDEYEIKATFAFVMAFLLSDRQQRAREELFQDQEIEGKNWLTSFRIAQAEGDMEGWCMPELLEIVQSHERHEIGCHSFSHLPLDEDLVSAYVMRREIGAAMSVAKERRVSMHTFIYPRNRIGHVGILAEAGFAGYRDRLTTRSGPIGRASSLLAEINVLEKPQWPESSRNDITVIPSGYFFNWRHGARKLVPKTVTEHRWANLLSRAARDGGVVHLWLHPHNIISAPETFDVLRSVMRNVASHQATGGITVKTQQEYCAGLAHR